ncbi:methyltransferase domain-containing protein [Frankia sp. CNm7]|uniref:Methyltransferase domain-containing protein n=1 Tax=Frankia nepalensis TaxID=1836974 RepID=A0A937RD29_9ACTN|nr:class I SAM-dependent methyltransferase [Frankia nepalensis]MBL7501622.1 methyltransferase domain-containing protein [Frankia nepalensis]MBL7514319.1 methyltransferase domain-containing protein [Frankia nepalensis]MBL7517856.1 methyltransferase domain-containing protein [Frankia nepalensis]MBL7628042.1 methyltransferase domain-containing protein [Frankia nepalensis]
MTAPLPDHPAEHDASRRWIHRDRQRAESFGVDAERYDRARPSYPEALVDRILEASPGRDVLDVGCGTGIAARRFLAAGCRVLGVEIDPRMAELARRHGIDVEVGAFETWDAAGRSFDAVVAGEAWHWVEPVAGAVRAAQVLRPGGRLAVFWNMGHASPEVAEAIAAVYRRLAPDPPARNQVEPDDSEYVSDAARAADGIRRAGALGEPECWRFAWDRPYTRDEWLDELPTHSDHRRLAPTTLATLLAQVGAALDAVGGGFTMRYTTIAVTATLTTAAA